MAQGVTAWSTTAATNATADASVNWAEGMPPSAVNDSARAMMARIADWRDSLNGTNATTGGTTAYVLTSDQSFAALAAGLEVAFQINATNTGTSTLNVDSLGAKPLRSAANVEVVAGALKVGAVYRATYFTSNSGEWLLHDCTPTIIASDQVVTASIANDAVTYAKMQNVSATKRALGRNTSGSGDVEEVTAAQIVNWIGTPARGDMIRQGASDPERVTIGAASTVWTSDGTDPAWATPPIIKVSTQTASSSSVIEFTGLSSAYRRYRVEIDNAIPATDQVAFVCEVSTGSYQSSGYQSVIHTADAGGPSAYAPTTAVPLSAAAGSGAVDNSTSYGWCGEVEIINPSNTATRKTVLVNGSMVRNTAFIYHVNGSGFWDGGNDAITAIRFKFSSGNIASGKFTLYGMV